MDTYKRGIRYEKSLPKTAKKRDCPKTVYHGKAVHIINSAGIAYHQNKVLHIIIAEACIHAVA
jgi:hypothetical protein